MQKYIVINAQGLLIDSLNKIFWVKYIIKLQYINIVNVLMAIYDW